MEVAVFNYKHWTVEELLSPYDYIIIRINNMENHTSFSIRLENVVRNYSDYMLMLLAETKLKNKDWYEPFAAYLKPESDKEFKAKFNELKNA